MPAVGSFKKSPEFQFYFVLYGSIFAEFCILEKSILFWNTQKISFIQWKSIQLIITTTDNQTDILVYATEKLYRKSL